MAPHGYEKFSAHAVDLSNKQVYLAQVPADFDPRKAEFKSETEISCQGTTYFVSASASIAECGILSQSNKGILSPSSTKLAGLLALTKKVSLPKVDYEEVIQEKPLISPVEGLRMRNFPSGYGPKSFGVEEQESKAKVLPAPTSSSTSGTRRKHSDKSGDGETPRKKHKKDKHGNKEERKKKKSHKEETA